MAKTLLYFFAYFDFDVIKTSFESICKKDNQLEIVVIENKSPYTEASIKPYFLNLLKDGRISRYYLFGRNLANNALEIVFGREMRLIEKTDYFFITDGDLLLQNDADWLSEQAGIIKNNEDVFACGISLSLDNLPIKNFPEANTWTPPDKSVHETYYETKTGIHLLILRSKYFLNYWAYQQKKGLNFVDGAMHKFCYANNKKWARTKHSIARHLTWDSYQDLNHPYTKQKLSKTFKATWHTKKYFSLITLYTKNQRPVVFIAWSTFLKKQVLSSVKAMLVQAKNKLSK